VASQVSLADYRPMDFSGFGTLPDAERGIAGKRVADKYDPSIDISLSNENVIGKFRLGVKQLRP